ncbi:hypothetical protein GGF32_001005 [Allomyces javanicus]|nr:hypothetical protein GGF32_001005 [Allomyces javanicus]
MFNHEPTNAAADRLRAHGGPDPWPWIVKEARDANYVLHDEVMTGSATTVAVRAVALAQGGLSCPLQYPFSQISPLHLAVFRNRLDMVRVLCAHRATAPLIHARDRWHRTPLAYAAIEGHAEIAACLVEYGAPVNPTSGAVNALYVACAARGGTHDTRSALVDLLLACRADTTNVVGDSLVHAALAPQDALSATLLATLVRVLGPAALHTCASGRNGKTPLHMLLASPWTDSTAQVVALRTAMRVLAVHKSPPGIDPFLVRDDLGRKPWTELVTWATAEGAPASAATLVAAVLDARVSAEQRSDSAARLSSSSDSVTTMRPSPAGPAPPPPSNGPLVVRIPRSKPPSPRAPAPATLSSADSRSRPALSDLDRPSSPVDDDDDSSQSDASYSPERPSWTGRSTRTSSRRSSVTTIDTRAPATDANGGRLTRARKEKKVDLTLGAGDVIALLPHMDEVTSDPVWFGLVTSRHRLHFATEAATTKVTFRYLERVDDPPNTPPDTVTYRVLKPTAKVTIAQLMPAFMQPVFVTRPHPTSPALEGAFRADRARVWLLNADVVHARETALQIAAADGTLATAQQARGDAKIMAELDKKDEGEMALAGRGGAPRQNRVETTGRRGGGGKRPRSASPGAGAAGERPRKGGRRDDREAHVVLPSDPDRQQQQQQRRRHEQGPEPIVID